MAKIEVYYAEICGLCHKALRELRGRNLPVVTHEVHWDAEKDDWVPSPVVTEMRRRAGDVDFVPQIFINDTVHIPGWRKLEPMIASGEFDRLLKEHGLA